jgi:cysteine desulfurase
LDCNATTPLEPTVKELIMHHLAEEVGNAGSRTHEFGQRAKETVQKARAQVASVVSAQPDEVIFTSGATESNNITLMGLAPYGLKIQRRHIISTQIEHKAVLEPLAVLEGQGFEVTYLQPDARGVIEAQAVKEALRPDTLAVSIMHVNNETGVEQPILEIAEALREHDAFFHIDAAQGFGKSIDPLRSNRIDLLSISSHKIYGPVGVGALVARKRGYKRTPLSPIMFGGGQEKGLRPGTLPVPLIAGFGLASELAQKNNSSRTRTCKNIKMKALKSLQKLDVIFHGDQERTLPHVLCFSIKNVDSEAAMVALKGIAAVSNGSACTSSSYKPSHVLAAMGLKVEEISCALRVSWCHLTKDFDWDTIIDPLAALAA